MKAKERHELTTNQLAEVLGHWIPRLKPYVSHMLIGLVILVVAIVYVVSAGLPWLGIRGRAAQRQGAEAMMAFPDALLAGGELVAGPVAANVVNARVQALDSYLSQYPDSPLCPLVEKNLADYLYDRALLTWAAAGDAAKVDDDLARAEQLYKKLVDRRDRVGPWARLGLACTVYERGNKQESERMLLAVARDNPDSDVELAANQRLLRIRQGAPLKFAAPKPEARSGAEKGPPPKTDEGQKAPAQGEIKPPATEPAPAAGADQGQAKPDGQAGDQAAGKLAEPSKAPEADQTPAPEQAK